MFPESRSPRPAIQSFTGHCAILPAWAQLLVISSESLGRGSPLGLPHVNGMLPTLSFILCILGAHPNAVTEQNPVLALKSSFSATSPGPFPNSEELDLERWKARAAPYLGDAMLRQPFS